MRMRTLSFKKNKESFLILIMRYLNGLILLQFHTILLQCYIKFPLQRCIFLANFVTSLVPELTVDIMTPRSVHCQLGWDRPRF